MPVYQNRPLMLVYWVILGSLLSDVRAVEDAEVYKLDERTLHNNESLSSKSQISGDSDGGMQRSPDKTAQGVTLGPVHQAIVKSEARIAPPSNPPIKSNVQNEMVPVTSLFGALVNARPRTLAFIGIFTAADAPGKWYARRRRSIRRTWLIRAEYLPQLEARFVVGNTHSAVAQAQMEAENEEYNDFMFLSVEECYKCLPSKTMAFFRAVSAQFDARWVIKMDDDIYLNLPRLTLAMQQWAKMRADYIGCMKRDPVIKQPASKWYEPTGYLLGKTYHLHAYGSFYAVSGEILRSVVVPNLPYFRPLANEDTSFGLWMLAFDVRFFEDMRLCGPTCKTNGVAFTEPLCSGLCRPIRDMYRLHKDEVCRSPAQAPLPYMNSLPGHERFNEMHV